MIRLKENIDPKELEKYGFEADHNRGKRLEYRYHLFKDKSGTPNFQAVNVYIDGFKDVCGRVVYAEREVVAIQHAFECDKAVNLIAKLLIEGIFEYVETEVFATVDEYKLQRDVHLKNQFNKCIELSKGLAMSKSEWERRGGTYRGSNTRARQNKFYNVVECIDRGMDPTDNEFDDCKDYVDLIGSWTYENRLLIKPLIEELGYYPYFPAFFRPVRKRCKVR